MAFASSSSAFGAKPAGSSIFGSTPATGGSIFGQPAAASGSNTGSSLFGNTQQQQQPQQQSQPTGTSLFGQPQAAAPTTGSSLFGQPAAASGSSLFGQSSAAKNTTSLFGGTTSTTQPSAFGGFGAQQQQPQQQQQPAASSSLFGQPQQQQQPQQGTSLFGGFGQQQQQQQQPQQQQTGGLFGQSTQNQNTGFGGGLGASTLFGRPPSQQPLSATQLNSQQANAPPFTKSTKFNDLPENVKKVFENLESHIQGRIQISNDLKQRKVGDEAAKGQELIRSVHKDLLGSITLIQNDVSQTRDIKAKVDQTVNDAIVAIRIIDGYRNPQANGYLKAHAGFPLEFFTRTTEEMKERLRWCKLAIESIERKLSSVATQSQYTPQAITSTLEAQHQTFIALAAKTAALDAELQKVKQLYTQLWRSKTDSMRDPFNEYDQGAMSGGGEFGLEGLGK
ncbi:hypothetical protein ABKN59_006121 [Abortiporus biennis]